MLPDFCEPLAQALMLMRVMECIEPSSEEPQKTAGFAGMLELCGKVRLSRMCRKSM